MKHTHSLDKHFWIMKTDADVYSIMDLFAEPDQKDLWDGVRNYQARNMIRDDMKIGDQVLVYHSVRKPVGIAGTAEICHDPYPDPTQFDTSSRYFDPKATQQSPRWYSVDIKGIHIFKDVITLPELRQYDILSDLWLLRKGQRLSILPLSGEAYDFICSLR